MPAQSDLWGAPQHGYVHFKTGAKDGMDRNWGIQFVGVYPKWETTPTVSTAVAVPTDTYDLAEADVAAVSAAIQVQADDLAVRYMEAIPSFSFGF